MSPYADALRTRSMKQSLRLRTRLAVKSQAKPPMLGIMSRLASCSNSSMRVSAVWMCSSTMRVSESLVPFRHSPYRIGGIRSKQIYRECSIAPKKRSRDMEPAGGGHIVNISSLAGKNAFAGGAAYNASKFALTGFSEAVMLDARNDNVRVSYIMPGSVATEFSGTVTGQDWKIWPEDIAEIVQMLLEMPERTLISRVEVRPARPKR